MDGEIPREQQTPVQMEAVNWAPWWNMRTEGTPNLATQMERKNLTQVSAVMELNEATSDQHVIQSFMLRR